MPPAELPSQIVTAISFIGRGGGAVKTLPGFKKSHHSVPDAANATTNAFLAKICEPELAADAEKLFQDVRTALGYKRKDIALSVSGALAALTARDFTVEMLYALEEADPARYAVTTTLLSLRDAELARRAEFARVFAGKFSEISFALKKGARVEAVIDAIEALEPEGDAPRLAVDYPSDCRECTISVPGVEAQVRCTGGTLDVIFPRGGAPAELIDAFAEIRAAFQISQVLAGLIG